MTQWPNDHAAMIAAADDWGSDHDPNRRHFLAGWRDEADRAERVNEPPRDQLAALCGYNSGVIAAREHGGGLQ